MIAAAVILAGCFCPLIFMIHNDLNRTKDDVAADEAVIEAEPLVRIDSTEQVMAYYPQFSHIDLVCATMPSQSAR